MRNFADLAFRGELLHPTERLNRSPHACIQRGRVQVKSAGRILRGRRAYDRNAMPQLASL